MGNCGEFDTVLCAKAQYLVLYALLFRLVLNMHNVIRFEPGPQTQNEQPISQLL
jgi:hypothetical protein